MKQFVTYFIAILFFGHIIALLSPIKAATYQAMSYNFRWVKPTNISLLKSCLAAKNIDFAAFQELGFLNGASLATFQAEMEAIGYKHVNTTYANNRSNNLFLIYKNTYQLVSGPQETIIGGGSNIGDNTRKIVTIKVKDPATQQEIQLFNHHPVTGSKEPSCDQAKVSYQYVKSVNAPYSILMGDFNLELNNSVDANKQTTCNALTSSLFSISCRPGITSQRTQQECGGKTSSNLSNIDFIMTPLSSKLLITDSYFDRCGFVIGANQSNPQNFDSDHVPLFATLTDISVPTPTPTSNIPTATPTITPTPPNTPTPTPTPGPRMAECNACGYCLDRTPPDGVENCMKCLYPGLSLEDTLRIDLDTGRAPQSKKGAYYTQLGCVDVGVTSFSDPQSAGIFLNFLLTKLFFPIAGVLALLALIYGAFLLVTSQDNPEQIARGRGWIIGAIVGVVFISGAVLLIQTIGGDILKIPGIN